MATKKRATTTKSSKKSTKRSTAKKTNSKSGVSAKRLTEEVVVMIEAGDKHRPGKYIKGRITEVTPGKFKIKTFAFNPEKEKKNKVEGAYGLTKLLQAKGSKKKTSTPRGASSTAPVVYQTLREKVAAVEENIGKTQSLKDFLDSAGWR